MPLSYNHPYFGQISSSTQVEVDTKKTKYDSREEIVALELSSELTPWTLRFERAHRSNIFSAFNSKKFLREEV